MTLVGCRHAWTPKQHAGNPPLSNVFRWRGCPLITLHDVWIGER